MSDRKIQISTLTSEQCLEIVTALFQRSNIPEQAKESFQKSYQNLPPKMLETAITHVYLDGIRAALEWLVTTELFLRDPNREILSERTYHLLYHLYNWHQFCILLPEGTQKLLEIVEDAKEAISNEDRSTALAAIRDLEKRLQGKLRHPEFEEDI